MRKGLLVSLMGLSLCLPGANSRMVSGSESLPDEAHLGDVISLSPKEITYNGESKTSSVRYKTPTGGLFSSSSLRIESPGVYTVEYYASFSGQEVVESHEILSLRHSSDLFSTSGMASVANSSFSLDKSITGVAASFQSGGTVTFDKTIDLSSSTKDDLLAELLIDPSSVGSSDLTRLTITLRDASDSNNNLYITLNDSGSNCDGEGTYVKTGANTQTLCGYEGSKLLTNAEFGTPIRSSFRGLPENDATRSEHTVKLYFDQGEKAIYTASSWLGTPWKRMVADLDSSTDFPGNLWGGFADGKAKMSFSVSGLYSKTAKVELLEIGGFDLRSEDQRDSVAPTITVDCLGESAIPDAVVGSKYSLFPATASDDYDESVEVKRAVSFQSTDSSLPENDVSIEDGSFLATGAGTYKVNYLATDLSGNTSTESLSISCGYSHTPISIFTSQENLSAEVYSTVTLLPLNKTVTSGGSGEIDLSLIVLDPDGNPLSYTENPDSSFSFIPSSTGEYRLVYSASDYLGFVQNLVRKVNVSPLTKAAFITEPTIPEVLIKGFTYALDFPKAKMPGEKGAVDADVTATVNGASVASSFVASGEKATIVFTAGTGTASTSKSYDVTVVDGHDGQDQRGYFYGDFTVGESEESLDLTFEKDSSCLYANPLSNQSFTLEFNYVAEEWNFSSMRFSLYETDDSTSAISLIVTHEAEGLYLEAGGQKVLLPDNSGFARIYIDFSTGEVDSVKGEPIMTLSSFDSGKAYSPFAGPLYLRMASSGVTSNSSLALKRLNNQPLGYRGESLAEASDLIAPNIVYQGSLRLKRTKGESASTIVAKGYDVLSEVTSLTVSVYDPDGTLILDKASAGEAHSFTLDKLGDYTLRYAAVDSSGNKTTSPKVIHVVSDSSTSAPTLEVGSLASVFDFGTAVELPSYSASDDSGSCTLNVILITPENRRLLLLQNVDGVEKSYLTEEYFSSSFYASDKSFYPESKGRYILRYVVNDGDYNLASAEVSFSMR